MELGQRVEYPVDMVNTGVGILVEFDPVLNLAKVVDVDDGLVFSGPADELIPSDDHALTQLLSVMAEERLTADQLN